jgi:hypothetical protein
LKLWKVDLHRSQRGAVPARQRSEDEQGAGERGTDGHREHATCFAWVADAR